MNRRSLIVVLATSLILTGCFRTRADIAKEREERENRATLHQSVVDYQQNIDRLQAELGRMQGKIEELEHQRRKEMSSVSSSTEGTSKTVAELKTNLEETQKTQAVLFEEIKRLREENLQLLKNSSKPARNDSPSSKAPSGQKKKSTASFEGALASYKAKDYESAASAFRAYLANPKAKKAVDARFMLADSLYRQKEYADAIVEFGVVQEKSPTTALGRKSMLKIAESFKALGNNKDAKAFAQLLVQTSPQSSEAKEARKFLR